MLNVNSCGLNDRDAKILAQLISNSYQFKMLFMHNNKVMGPGAIQIADAIASSETMEVFDISFNSICSNARIVFPSLLESLESEPTKRGKKGKHDNSANTLFQDYAERWSNMF